MKLWEIERPHKFNSFFILIPGVSFYAGSDEAMTNLAVGDKVKFQKIVTNIGGAYQENGTFIAPHEGAYVFIWTILCQNGPDNYVNVHLKKNDEQQGIVQAHCKEQNTQSSNTAVLFLKPNDAVYLEVTAQNKGQIYGHMHSTFAGWSL